MAMTLGHGFQALPRAGVSPSPSRSSPPAAPPPPSPQHPALRPVVSVGLSLPSPSRPPLFPEFLPAPPPCSFICFQCHHVTCLPSYSDRQCSTSPSNLCLFSLSVTNISEAQHCLHKLFLLSHRRFTSACPQPTPSWRFTEAYSYFWVSSSHPCGFFILNLTPFSPDAYPWGKSTLGFRIITVKLIGRETTIAFAQVGFKHCPSPVCRAAAGVMASVFSCHL